MTSPQHQQYSQVLQQHRALKDLVARLECVLTERSMTVDGAAALIGQLGDLLIRHFALEERGGYFAEALTQAPHLVASANELMAQHPKMADKARQIAGEGAAEAWWDQTRESFQAFVRELLEHERREDQLLQEAYGRDLSAHD